MLYGILSAIIRRVLQLHYLFGDRGFLHFFPPAAQTSGLMVIGGNVGVSCSQAFMRVTVFGVEGDVTGALFSPTGNTTAQRSSKVAGECSATLLTWQDPQRKVAGECSATLLTWQC